MATLTDLIPDGGELADIPVIALPASAAPAILATGTTLAAAHNARYYVNSSAATYALSTAFCGAVFVVGHSGGILFTPPSGGVFRRGNDVTVADEGIVCNVVGSMIMIHQDGDGSTDYVVLNTGPIDPAGATIWDYSR